MNAPALAPAPHVASEAVANEGTWILVRVVGDVDAELVAEVLAELGAALSRDGIRVESEPMGAGPALATIELDFRGGEALAVVIEIRDALTNKRVARTIDLTYVPEDGRGLTIAATTEELLDASWAEVALAHWQDPEPTLPEDEPGSTRTPAPAPVRARVEDSLARSEARRARVGHRLGVGPRGAWTSGGLGTLGGGFEYELRLLGRLGLVLGGYGLGVLAPRVEVGRISGSGGMGHLGLLVGAGLRRVFDLDVGGYAAAGELVVVGRREDDGSVRQVESVVVEAGGVLQPSVRVREHLRLEFPISVGTMLRGVELRDAGREGLGLRGIHLSFGVRFAWTSWGALDRRRP